MSFGRAASGVPGEGFARVAPGADCPCGRRERFDGCCGAVLGGRPAPTAERLMRSRYTAFVVGDARHLAASWHPGTRPDDVTLDPALRWTGLEIVQTQAGGPEDMRGTVEFRATWRNGAERGELHERSRFVRWSGSWWYVDGQVMAI